jgi:hypothetical protein
MILVTFVSIHFVIICDVLLWHTYETHPALSLKSGCDSRPLGFGAVDHWSLLSSCSTRPSGGTPDSPVWSDIVDCLLTFDGQTVPQSTVGEVDHCFVGSPDSPVVHRTIRWTLVDERWENPRTASSRGAQPGHQILYAPNFVEFSQVFFFVCLCWTICT